MRTVNEMLSTLDRPVRVGRSVFIPTPGDQVREQRDDGLMLIIGLKMGMAAARSLTFG